MVHHFPKQCFFFPAIITVRKKWNRPVLRHGWLTAVYFSSMNYTRKRRTIIKDFSKNPFLSARELASTSGTIITPQTIKNILLDENIRERVPRGKKYILKQIEWKDLNLQKLASANRRIFFSPMKASSVFLA